MIHTTNAKNCFAENFRLFGDARTQPERFNLYKGLVALADAIATIQEQQVSLERRLREIENRVKKA